MALKLSHVSDNLIIFSFATAAQFYKLPHWDWRKTILMKKALFEVREYECSFIIGHVNTGEFMSGHIVSKQIDKLMLVGW